MNGAINRQYSVILMPSTSHAMKAETILLKNGTAYKLIPVPRHISSDCGVCIRVHTIDLENSLQNLSRGGVTVQGTVPLKSS